jgi:thiol-disulfide isomerase/thioredoxin
MKVIKFGAIWCPSCLVMRPIWNVIEKEYPEIMVENYDYDIDSEEVNKWNIGKVLPVAIILDEDENEVSRLIGEKTKKQIIDTIDDLYKKE